MIDGIKIYCNNLSQICWERLPYLSFATKIDEQTGEQLSKTRHAEYKGLHFELKPSTTINNKVHYYMHGSLAKYHNNGLDNAFDYDFECFCQSLADLQKTFNIEPQQTILRGFEFGLNISLPFPVKTALDRLKTFKSNRFAAMYAGRQNIGYKADRQQYTLKIYDKGKQAKTKKKNLLRIEMQVKKMEFVKAFSIHTLADLAKPEIWQVLYNLLLSYWAECLYINDKDFNYKAMPDRVQKKFLRYINPQYWDELTEKKQRLRAKQGYKQICNLYQYKEEKEIITSLIIEKLEKLKPKNAHLLTNSLPIQITQNYKQNTNSKCPPFNHLDKGLISTQNKSINYTSFLVGNKKQKKVGKPTKKKVVFSNKKKCLVCSSSIKSKLTHVKYCSKQCNNKYHYQKRRKMKDKQKKAELLNLDKIIKLLPKRRLWLTVTYKHENSEYTDTLHQSEIVTSPDWIKKIKKVQITGIRKNTLPITLTTIRAKKLIRILTKINKK